MIQTTTHAQFGHIATDQLEKLETFLQRHPQGNFFQSPAFFRFLESVPGYRPFQVMATGREGAVAGQLLGVFQTNGTGIRSWMSRRLIVWGGPLVSPDAPQPEAVVRALLKGFLKHAGGKAIFVEFRNFFDTTSFRPVFEEAGFEFRPHLNYLVRTDDAAEVKKRMSKSRWRQIKSSLKAGAETALAQSEEEIVAFYEILQTLYKEKVKKPLADLELFLHFWKADIGKFFLVKYEGEVVGGIMCPVFADKVIYEWYVCGKDGLVKGLHPSVLATWAPIEYGVENGFSHFDFMGAGKPEEDYGVREFKARFGGEEVAYGRYYLVLNKPLYEVGKIGLKVYQNIK